MDTTILQVGLFRVNAARAELPHYAPQDGDPVIDESEAKEAFIQVFSFHGNVQNEGGGVWLVELPVDYERSARTSGYWVEGNDEYDVTCEWPE